MKICRKCNEAKPDDAFTYGRNHCKTCRANAAIVRRLERKREWKRANPHLMVEYNRRWLAKLAPHCPKCKTPWPSDAQDTSGICEACKAKNREYYQQNRERINAGMKAYWRKKQGLLDKSAKGVVESSIKACPLTAWR